MKTVTIVQEYNVSLPKEYEDLTPEELVDDLNRMYDIHGQKIVDAMNTESDYVETKVTQIDDVDVFMEDGHHMQCISNSGYEIILDGQQLLKAEN